MQLEIKYVGHTGSKIDKLTIEHAQLNETVEDQFLIVTGVDLTGILGGRMAGLNIKVLAKHIFLHCNASNLVLKILQHDTVWRDNPPAPNSGGTCPPSLPPPCSTPMDSDRPIKVFFR